MRWEPVSCTAGDIIRVRLGAVYHYGIFVSEDEVIAFGLPPVPAYRTDNEDIKVLSTDIETFSCGNITETAVPDRADKRRMLPKAKTIETARARIGEGGYHILHNNCEHFVNECVFGVKFSEQENELRRRWRSFRNRGGK